MIALAIGLFLIPSIPSWTTARTLTASSISRSPSRSRCSIVYVAVTVYTLRRHHIVHVASDDEIDAWSFKRRSPRSASPPS